MEILTKMGVLEGGKIVGVLGQRREASLAEMSLQANQLFRFEMAGDLNLNFLPAISRGQFHQHWQHLLHGIRFTGVFELCSGETSDRSGRSQSSA